MQRPHAMPVRLTVDTQACADSPGGFVEGAGRYDTATPNHLEPRLVSMADHLVALGWKARCHHVVVRPATPEQSEDETTRDWRRPMSLLDKVKKSSRAIFREIYSLGPFPGIAQPIFILGCGRSGTTILGHTLSKHRKINYLNEPRNLWFSAYPETDVWTSKARSRGGKLYLSESDVDPRKSNRIRRMFRFTTIVSGRPVLIEKLPINNFRLRFIRAIFPDARYIHIYRNGLEVARSIEEANRRGGWFGADCYKWSKLVEYASAEGSAGDVTGLCASDFEKGLLEWRLSTESAVSFLSKLPDAAYFELSYDDFVTRPLVVVSQLLEFIGVGADADIDAFVTSTVSRRSVGVSDCDVSEKQRKIGGHLLPFSMNGCGALTKRGKH